MGATQAQGQGDGRGRRVTARTKYLSSSTVQSVAFRDATDRDLTTEPIPVGSPEREEVIGELWLVAGDYLDGDPDALAWLRSPDGEERIRSVGLSPSRFVARLQEIYNDPGVRGAVAKVTRRHERARAWLQAIEAMRAA